MFLGSIDVQVRINSAHLKYYHLLKSQTISVDLKSVSLTYIVGAMPKLGRRKLGRPPTGRISVHVFLDKNLDEELSKAAAREGVHRSVIVERALAKELQVSVNHNEDRLEKMLDYDDRNKEAADRLKAIMDRNINEPQT